MIKNFENLIPDVPDSCFVAESAELMGDIKLGENVSIWYGSVLRGDINHISIGDNTNIQDMSVIHGDTPKEPDFSGATIIGRNVTVGHRALIHACEIEDDCLIGMGAVILSGAKIGRGSIIAAGAVVREHQVVEPYSLVAGVPAKVKGCAPESMKEKIALSAKHYVELAQRHIKNRRG